MTVVIGQLDVIAAEPPAPPAGAAAAPAEAGGQGPRVVDVALALEREADRRARVEPD